MPYQRHSGFTLLELMVVVAVVAVASGIVALSLRGAGQRELDTSAARIVAALEQGRTASRATGVRVLAELHARGGEHALPRLTFAPPLPGLAPLALPAELGWRLNAQTEGSSDAISRIALGPEPLIGRHRIELSLGADKKALVTDGLRPFRLEASSHP